MHGVWVTSSRTIDNAKSAGMQGNADLELERRDGTGSEGTERKERDGTRSEGRDGKRGMGREGKRRRASEDTKPQGLWREENRRLGGLFGGASDREQQLSAAATALLRGRVLSFVYCWIDDIPTGPATYLSRQPLKHFQGKS